MPTAIGSVIEFYNEIRARVGCHDRNLLLDTDLETACRTSLRRFNRDFPHEGFAYFLTVNGQEEYAGVVPANAYDVIKIYWQPVGGCACEVIDALSIYDSYFIVIGGSLSGGVSVFDYPAQVGTFKAKLAEFNWFFRGRGRYMGESIWLTPAPSADGDRVYFKYTYPRYTDTTLKGALEDVEQQDVETLITLCCAHAHRMIANRSRLVEGATGATKWKSDGGKGDREEAARLEKEYQALVHQGLVPMMR